MSEIDNLYAQISYCESQISSLQREQNEGYVFISMIRSGFEDTQDAIYAKEKKKLDLYSEDSESTFVYALGDNVKENYGTNRLSNIQYGFDEIVNISNHRIRDIEYEIDRLNLEISNCRNRIAQILEEMERQRRLQEELSR